MTSPSKIVIFNDPHFTHHPPECREDTYSKEILAKLQDVAYLAAKLEALGVFCTGDWFHRKGKATFREANSLVSLLDSWRRKGLEVGGILGNHDIAGHALSSLDNRASGSLVHSRVLRLLDQNPLVKQGFYLTGTSYFHGCDSSDESRVKMYGAERPEDIDPDLVHVHLAHGTLVQKGTFFEDFTVAPELVELLAEHERLPDVIVCGHLHYNEGIKLYGRPGSKKKVAVCRVGSLGRVAADDLLRVPQALVVASHRGNFVCKAVPIGEPIDRTKDPSTRTSADEARDRVQEFVRVLREEADEVEIRDQSGLLAEITDRMGYDHEVLRLALTAVEKRQ